MALWTTYAASRAADETSAHPDYHSGDSWLFHYQESDGTKRNRRAEVIAVEPDHLVIGWGPAGVVRQKQNFSLDLNEYDSEGAELRRIHLPMTVGDSWKSTWKWQNADSRGESTVTWKVIEKAEITINGRALDAFHVEGSGFWTGYWVDPLGTHGRMYEEFWYSPAVKNIVKFDATSYFYTTGQRHLTYELHYELLRSNVR
jgi:hypothetical protein